MSTWLSDFYDAMARNVIKETRWLEQRQRYIDAAKSDRPYDAYLEMIDDDGDTTTDDEPYPFLGAYI